MWHAQQRLAQVCCSHMEQLGADFPAPAKHQALLGRLCAQTALFTAPWHIASACTAMTAAERLTCCGSLGLCQDCLAPVLAQAVSIVGRDGIRLLRRSLCRRRLFGAVNLRTMIACSDRSLNAVYSCTKQMSCGGLFNAQGGRWGSVLLPRTFVLCNRAAAVCNLRRMRRAPFRRWPSAGWPPGATIARWRDVFQPATGPSRRWALLCSLMGLLPCAGLQHRLPTAVCSGTSCVSAVYTWITAGNYRKQPTCRGHAHCPVNLPNCALYPRTRQEILSVLTHPLPLEPCLLIQQVG